MTCYLIRHGKDDETIRGGWSQHPLTEEGVLQIQSLAEKLDGNSKVSRIYTSDLTRALQTAQILADKMCLQIKLCPQFREVNNGCLAGMKNEIAEERYPGLYWNQLYWEQCYPDGESPSQFYDRIYNAWLAFSDEILSLNENVSLITHGGVIHVVRSILENRPYSNKEKQRSVRHGEVIELTYIDGTWVEM